MIPLTTKVRKFALETVTSILDPLSDGRSINEDLLEEVEQNKEISEETMDKLLFTSSVSEK